MAKWLLHCSKHIGATFLSSLMICLYIQAATVVPTVLAQGAPPFLVTPYYGKENINQVFNPGGGHDGVDYDLEYEKVLATADGTISLVRWESNSCHNSGNTPSCSYGLNVRIDHGGGFQTIYGHLSAAAFPIGTSGQAVKRGQVIGISGNTGYSTGTHLHFEIRYNNLPTNPDFYWLDGERANPSRPIPAPRQGEIFTVDDGDGGFSKGQGGPFNNPCPPGSCQYWFGVGSGGYNSDRFWTSSNSIVNNYWARWQPSIASNNQGWYEVQAHIPDNDANSWQVPYTIQHADGSTTVTVDQYDARNAPGDWVSLGTYRLTPGARSVHLTKNTGEGYRVHCFNAIGSPLGFDYCQIAADAVRFVRQTTYLPDIRSATGDGWDSAFYIRNDGAGPTDISINVLNENGTSAGDGSIYGPK